MNITEAAKSLTGVVIEKSEIEILEGAIDRKEKIKSIYEEPRIGRLVQISVQNIALQSKALIEVKRENELANICKIINPLTAKTNQVS